MGIIVKLFPQTRHTETSFSHEGEGPADPAVGIHALGGHGQMIVDTIPARPCPYSPLGQPTTTTIIVRMKEWRNDVSNRPSRIVVMGVAGSGKSTVATALAERLEMAVIDADAFHPSENVAKMSAGAPLTDEDRQPWLRRLRDELRSRDHIVLACSALRRSYRDILRSADDVVFVFLDVGIGTAVSRAEHRAGHFMGAGMVSSQFVTLERPDPDEVDVITIDASLGCDPVVDAAMASIGAHRPRIEPLFGDGGPDRIIDGDDLARHISEVAESLTRRGARRVLLVPPDHTRLHSRAGEITVGLRDALTDRGVGVGVLPALGTHAVMEQADADVLFGGALPTTQLLRHDWRSGLRSLGRLTGAEVADITAGRYDRPVEVAIDEQLFGGWDVVVSIGQVVPHEVIGMANFTKNLVIGLGGAPTIHVTHVIGALCGMESIMGRTTTPVRDLVDLAFDRFVDPLVDVMWVLTVVEDTGQGVFLRGLYVGEGGSGGTGGAAYRRAAALAATVNVTVVDEPADRVVCWLDPHEFRSTWLGNKAVYRTRMAIARGGELVVLAPGVNRFGEDDQIDALIRRHGYTGTPATIAALDTDPELASNLSAAAHLIHGSSEGRFRVVYCTGPGGLTRAEVESVGYEWRPLDDELDRLDLTPGTATTGRRSDRDGAPYTYIVNPALGLWVASGGTDPRN